MSASARKEQTGNVQSYRTKLLLAMMLVVIALTVTGLVLAHRKVAVEARLDLLQDFSNELATLHSVQEMRHAALAERCRTLVLRPRIHAALWSAVSPRTAFNQLDHRKLRHASRVKIAPQSFTPSSPPDPRKKMAPQRTDLREIERKFLVRRPPEGLTSYPHALIEQGYLALEEGGVQVRLRRAGDVLSLTYKRGTKTTREEREVLLTAEQFEALWPATAERRLSKIRYDVPWQTWTIEIDVYAGRHEGLVVAEVEFDDDDACRNFIPPDWLGDDVSGDPRYSNVVLALQ